MIEQTFCVFDVAALLMATVMQGSLRGHCRQCNDLFKHYPYAYSNSRSVGWEIYLDTILWIPWLCLCC